MTYSYTLFNFSCSLLTVYLYVVDMLFLNWNWALCVQDILKFYFMYFKTHFINVRNFLPHFGHWKLLSSMEKLKYYCHYRWHMIILSSWLLNKLVSQKKRTKEVFLFCDISLFDFKSENGCVWPLNDNGIFVLLLIVKMYHILVSYLCVW